ncbi:hypothetical protein CMUS01_09551 [Colletotrichum musicola]|uniref:Uncharacterized protein n=1 Tax=Colletotrichum musicola TaxID=2175873 RepID=A0A8H6K780_9PEZI|nr:hypothetical protein CMUS01_09551 [Colletotrichum musicola]
MAVPGLSFSSGAGRRDNAGGEDPLRFSNRDHSLVLLALGDGSLEPTSSGRMKLARTLSCVSASCTCRVVYHLQVPVNAVQLCIARPASGTEAVAEPGPRRSLGRLKPTWPPRVPGVMPPGVLRVRLGVLALPIQPPQPVLFMPWKSLDLPGGEPFFDQEYFLRRVPIDSSASTQGDHCIEGSEITCADADAAPICIPFEGIILKLRRAVANAMLRL